MGGDAASLSWEPLGGDFGDFGAVVALDLTQPLGDAVRRRLLALFDARQLLVFHDQDITLEQQIALVTCFSPLVDDPPTVACSTANAGVGRVVTNVPADGNARGGEIQLHHEFAFLDPPIYGLSLWGDTIVDGDTPATLFLSSFDAYRRFPAELRARIGERRARQVRHDNYAGTPDRDHPIPDGALASVAPMHYEHPRTGEATLHFSPMYTHSVVGMSSDDSKALLDDLEAALRACGDVYRHGWRRHDLVVWDNLKVMHAREHVSVGASPRRLRRVPFGDPARYVDYSPDDVLRASHGTT